VKKKAIWLLIAEFFYELNFFGLIFSLFLKENNLTFMSISIIFMTRSIVKVIFEFPSGIVGDYLGRKKTVMLGLIISSSSYLLYQLVNPSYYIVVVVIEVIGYTLISGSLDAMFFEAIPKGDEEKYSALYSLFYRVSIAISAILTGIIAQNLGYSVCFYLSFFTCIISLIIILCIKDHNTDKFNPINPLSCIKYIFSSKAVGFFIGLGIIIDIVHIPLEDYYSLLLNSYGFSVKTTGYIYTVGLLFGALATFILAPYIKKKISSNKIIVIIPYILLLVDLIFVYSGGIGTIIFSVLSTLFFSMYSAYKFSLLNLAISDSYRSSVLSFISFTIGFSGIISNLTFGKLSPLYGVPHSLGIIITSSLIMLFLLNIFLGHGKFLNKPSSTSSNNFHN
jgi:hypothetical protein